MPHQALSDSMLEVVDIGAQIASAGVNGVVVDMQGYSGCKYAINLGTMANGATFDAVVYSSANSNFSGNAYIASTNITQVTNASNVNLVIIDVWRPTNRYLKLVTTPATANTTFGSTVTRYGRTGTNPATAGAIQTVKLAAN